MQLLKVLVIKVPTCRGCCCCSNSTESQLSRKIMITCHIRELTTNIIYELTHVTFFTTEKVGGKSLSDLDTFYFYTLYWI
jgi:hypothetical protein